MFIDKESFKKEYLEKIQFMHGKSIEDATLFDKYKTLGNMVRAYISKKWIRTSEYYYNKNEKQVYYLSLEFLMGRLLKSYLTNLGIRDIVKDGLQDLGVDLEEIEAQEVDPGLGSGGLGRLAADFLDSMASLNLPGHGHGIRYKYGQFEQRIVDGYQIELHDYWLREGYVWEIRKFDKAKEIRFWGNVRVENDENGKLIFHHENYETILAVPYDIPIVGYGDRNVNTLRLWSAESAIKNLNSHLLNHKEYHKIIDYKRSTEAISEYLYPDDSYFEGKILRLKQQYFLVSASLQSIINRFKRVNNNIYDIPKKIAIHINDTHPVLAIPELMRILMDQEGLGWDEAWDITINTISYTNHTTLEEALESWSIDIIKPLLPRIYMIIDEINERFCKELWNRNPGDWERISNMAIIGNGTVRMVNLAVVGSHKVNGVSKDHTEILKKQVLNKFYKIYPYKFNNKTNGITHRRWLLSANPLLANAITRAIGTSWIEHPTDLAKLLKFADDSLFQQELFRIKLKNKERLTKLIKEKNNINVDPNSIFDVQIKRMHAYKRQLLNLFHIMDLYNRLRKEPNLEIVPRTFIFSGKAAAGYHLAKNVIKLINTVADVINKDRKIQDKLKIVFIENYGVSLAEMIIPAAEVSEQLSTASKEASGTGNMKFMMNGALTIGTFDGANIEISDEVGEENIFIFGLKSEEVFDIYKQGNYPSIDLYNSDPRLKCILDQLINGFYSDDNVDFKSIYYSLLEHDYFMVLKDFDSYIGTQEDIDNIYRDQANWMEKSIINIAHSGKFSSDTVISEYASSIWEVSPVNIFSKNLEYQSVR